jgi:hypothetical protein
MKNENKRRFKIAMLLGAIGIAAAWIFFLVSPQHRLASQVIGGSQIRAVAGAIEFAFPSSFRLTGHRSSMTYYVIGSNRRGFLRMILENSDDGLRVKSAAFEEVPLALVDAGARSPAQ